MELIQLLKNMIINLKIRVFFIFSLFFFTFSTFAQHQNDYWYFGNGAGIHFNGGAIPVALTDGALNTFEGCASISDQNGNLLFYTDGITVYNKNHLVMTNGTGLMGHSSTTQSAVIVQLPGSSNIYYIFTLDDFAGVDGVRYSVVDINLQSGLGEVIQKNILIMSPAAEKIVVVKHSNNTDFWVIIHGWNNNIFYSYQLSASGLNLTPVQSAIGSIHSGGGGINNASESIGYMKVSNDTRFIALAKPISDIFEIFKFNNTTGVLSDPISINDPSPETAARAYGVEFSPDSKLLYLKPFYSQKVYQCSLQSYNLADITSSIQLIGSISGTYYYYAGAIQLGPDNKIYLAEYNRSYLSVISNPNNYGLSCNLIDEYVYLDGRLCQLGLPNLVNLLFFNNPISVNANGCYDGQYQFDVTGSNIPISYSWNFDDIFSNDNSSNIANPIHDFVQSGIHNVSLIYMLSNGSIDTIFYSLNVPSKPELVASDSITLCLPSLQNYMLCSTSGYQSYLWNTGSTSTCAEINATGIYTVTAVDSNSCIIMDSVFIDANQEYGFINDTMICTDEIIDFYGQIIDSAGVYTQEFITHQGCDSTYILNVNIFNCSSISAQGCFLGPIVFSLNSPIVPMSYNWNFDDPLSLSNVSSESNPAHVFSAPGGYDVKLIFVLNSGFQDTIISHIEVQSYPDLIAEDSIANCGASSPMIMVHSIGNMNSYSWENGSTSDSSLVTSEGWLGLNALDTNGCVINDSIFISFNLEYHFNADTTICDGEILDFFGQQVSNSGDYTKNYNTVNGCDSIYHLHVEKFNCSLFEVNACYLDSIMFIFANPTGNASCLWYFNDPNSISNIVQGDTVYHSFSSPGDYNVSFIYTLPSGYTDTITFNQQINESPELILEDSLFICYSAIPDYQINAEPGFLNYTWSNGVNQQCTEVSQSGNFYISAYDSLGCLVSDSVFVKFNISKNIYIDTLICLGETYAFGGEVLDDSGVYIDSLISDAGCDSVIHLTLSIRQLPIINLNDTSICLGQEIHIIPDTTGIINGYQWSDGYLSFDRILIDHGKLYFQVWNNCGMSVDSIRIDGIDCNSNLWFPNAFSPNGDFINSTFHGVGTNIDEFHLMIFNRWGQMLYETYSINEPWDGIYKGEFCPEGVYFWICEYTTMNSINKLKSGSVTLLR